MSVIAPAILTDSDDAYKASIERLQPFAQRVHIDITDGAFAPSFTLAPDSLWWPEGWQVDIHAMVASPAQYVDALIAKKPQMVIFHAEVEEDLLPTFARLKQAGIKVGLALQRPTVPSAVKQYIEAADHVMIFTGALGRYGGIASLMQLEKVRLVKAINPSAEIGWDGGVNTDNAYTLTQGAVDVLNVGKALATANDPVAVYNQLVSEINKHGVI